MRKGMGDYRGLRIDTGTWEYGCLSMGGGWNHSYDNPFIEPKGETLTRVPVRIGTVGQYTGKTDEDDGLKIFELDICSGLVVGTNEPVQGSIEFDEDQGMWCLMGMKVISSYRSIT